MPKIKDGKKMRLYHETLDGIRIKIDDNLFDYFLSKSPKVYNKETFYKDCDMDLWDNLILFDKYYIVNYGVISNGDKHRFDIVDKDKNKYGNIIYALKERKNNISYLELMGFFFKVNDLCDDIGDIQTQPLLRYDTFGQFIEFLKIPLHKQKLVKEIHYNIDVIGKEAHEIIDLLKAEKNYKGYKVDQLTATDLKKITRKKGIIEYGPHVTGLTIRGTYNNFVIYDKILDILQNYMNRKVDGVNPYQSYIDSEEPITRIELQKKGAGLQHLQDSSIDWIFNNIQCLYYDFLIKYFEINFRKLAPYKIDTLNGKTNFIAKNEKELKLLRSLSMFKAYARNLENILGKKEFEKEMLVMFPDIQNKSVIDYMDIIDVKDIFDNIN